MNLAWIPFSTRGSYMAVSYCPENHRGMENAAGLYLRSVRSSSPEPLVLRFVPLSHGEAIPYEVEATETRITLTAAAGIVEICFSDVKTLLLR